LFWAFRIIVTAVAADVFFVFLASVPLGFAGPVDLAVFTAICYFVRHNAPLFNYTLFLAKSQGLTLRRYLVIIHKRRLKI